ncbi:2-polyprenyl-3-methyl-5-hydroxy-6-metoxy-1,4-benzoquinol methylase [Paenibacillus eucommiae]|uniref:2-polyprenyl-3-methyl-5-hydroxy-6-metoxy-1, 4-benzoquinol methylase n=1 Tax=Paenibacillus eucommiae TaxID=1355755 RepID=A0ABS4IPS9_9BACL|nr:2-polyprenyl-3-methyl-5-hydroxy-6-metoxy-1,4-benzoquinol methylase [Paenibacillus eucommiae]
MDKNSVYKTNSFYWDTKGNDFLEAIVLPFYGAYVSEEQCQLFGDVSGKKMLEIGCGSGQSLQYQGERKASELWGLDLSENQIEKVRQHLMACGLFSKIDLFSDSLIND